jgi:hypothetical protein
MRVINRGIRIDTRSSADDRSPTNKEGCNGEKCVLQNSVGRAVLYESPYHIVPVPEVTTTGFAIFAPAAILSRILEN